jgi:hypothetical protein
MLCRSGLPRDASASRVNPMATSLPAEWRHRRMRTPPIIRATERVSLACQALKAAANDVLIAQGTESAPLESAAQELAVEVERVCELADQLERCAANVGELAGARA